MRTEECVERRKMGTNHRVEWLDGESRSTTQKCRSKLWCDIFKLDPTDSSCQFKLWILTGIVRWWQGGTFYALAKSVISERKFIAFQISVYRTKYFQLNKIKSFSWDEGRPDTRTLQNALQMFQWLEEKLPKSRSWKMMLPSKQVM